MLNLKDIQHSPSIKELDVYIQHPLFMEFFQYMEDTYQALYKITYSKDTWLRGWNIKFRKAGKSLCVLYPKENYFTLLVVISAKEKEHVEKRLPFFSSTMQAIYHGTNEGMHQRWLMIDIRAKDAMYQDTLQLIQIRRENK